MRASTHNRSAVPKRHPICVINNLLPKINNLRDTPINSEHLIANTKITMTTEPRRSEDQFRMRDRPLTQPTSTMTKQPIPLLVNRIPPQNKTSLPRSELPTLTLPSPIRVPQIPGTPSQRLPTQRQLRHPLRQRIQPIRSRNTPHSTIRQGTTRPLHKPNPTPYP